MNETFTAAEPASGSFTDHLSSLDAEAPAPAEPQPQAAADPATQPAENGGASGEPAQPATGEQPRGADGRFTSQDPAPAAETAVAAQGAQQSAGEETPAGFVRIDLPPDHPLREQGHDHVLAPAGQEETYRAFANSAARRREVEATRQYAEQLEVHLAQMTAQARELAEFNAAVFSDPRVIDTYRAIAEEQGAQAAQVWLQGLRATRGEQAQRYVSEAQQHYAEAALERQAAQVLDEVRGEAARYEHWTEAELTEALGAYASWMESTNRTDFSLPEFRRFADAIYVQNPNVIAAVREYEAQHSRAQQTQAQQEEQRAAEQRAQQERARRAAAENPLGAFPAGADTGHRVPAAAGAASTNFTEYLRSLDG